MAFTSILAPVEDMDLVVDFLSEKLGLEPRFRDGDRYAAFPQLTVSLGLLGKEERVAPETTLGLRVDDLAETISQWTGSGAEIIRPLEEGPHELRAVMRIPGGLVLTLSQKRAGG